MDIQLPWQRTVFFLIKPSAFSTRFIVLSEGKALADLRSSHLMAETPIWANVSSSSRFLVSMMCCLLISESF